MRQIITLTDSRRMAFCCCFCLFFIIPFQELCIDLILHLQGGGHLFWFLFHVFADTLSVAKKPILIERKFSKWEDGQKCFIVFNSAELRCPCVAVEQTDPPYVFLFLSL